MDWYDRITATGGMVYVADCIDHFTKEHNAARTELAVRGERIDKYSSMLPGIVEYRISQLQELESILEYLNILLAQKKSELFRKYTTAHAKVLSSRDAEKYIDGDPEYVDLALIINAVARVRNKYLSVSRGLEQMSWQIGNITRLRASGLDEATF